MGESIVAKKICRNCIGTVCGHNMLASLVGKMMEFDIIMGMDWLASCYATGNGRAEKVHSLFPRKTFLEWKGNIGTPRGKVLTYLKERKIISKGSHKI